jgi:cytochrome c553
MRARARAELSKIRVALLVAAALMLAGPQPVTDFEENLSRVDRALEENPSHVPPQVLQTCRYRRTDAVRLHQAGYVERAERRLRACFQDLKVSAPVVQPPSMEEQKEAPPSMEEIQARAAREIERALTLEPDVAKGLEIYRTCAECHKPEGWGLQGALIPLPQLAGQHRTVLIKQLADIRAGNRESVVMAPYATVELIGGAQAIADVAGYIDSLEMSVDTGKGPGKDLEPRRPALQGPLRPLPRTDGRRRQRGVRPADPGAALPVPGAPVRLDSEREAPQRESGDGDPDPQLQRSSDPGSAGLCLSARAPRGAPRTAGLAQSGFRALKRATRSVRNSKRSLLRSLAPGGRPRPQVRS